MIWSENPRIEVINGDCMEGMKEYPDKYFDLAIVDPPYGIGAGRMQMGSGKHIFKKGDWDKNIPNEKYFNKLFGLTKNQIIWGGNYYALPISNDWIIWDKLNPNLSFSEAELAWCSKSRNIRICKHYSANLNGQPKIHPTQKPVALYKWLLKNYANPGDMILDTHGGSLSISIACYDMGFDLTAFEIDKDYYDASHKRFNNHIAQLQLFK